MGQQILLAIGQNIPAPNVIQEAEVFRASDDTALHTFIGWAVHKAKQYNAYFVRLVIICHGYEPQNMKPPGAYDDENPFDEYSQGGGGLMFCNGGVHLDNLSIFKHLNGWLDWIEIHGCGAAYISPGANGGDGDGNVFCSRLAQYTGAPVQASTAEQKFYWNDFNGSGYSPIAPWAGTVVTYGPNGAVQDSHNYPTWEQQEQNGS